MAAPVQEHRRSGLVSGAPCSAPDCTQASVSMGLCWAHYARERRYGARYVTLSAVLAEQDQRCAVCGTAEPGGRLGWQTDHDHETGAVRGVLCRRCNVGLGVFGDCADTLERAARYLRSARLPSRKPQQGTS